MYDIRNLELAVEAVEHGICSSRKAAQYYGVPRSSVVSRIYRKRPRSKPTNPSPRTIAMTNIGPFNIDSGPYNIDSNFHS